MTAAQSRPLRTTPLPAATRPSRRQQALLKRLIYEVVDGQPIYYKGYRDVLNGTKTIEDLMGDSSLQAWLKFNLPLLLHPTLSSNGYEITVGEQVLLLGKKHRRDADIAIFRRENFVLDKHYSKLPPEAIIEIDIEADTQDSSAMAYVHGNIADYFAFGVKKVIWVFTDSEQVMVSTSQQPPQTLGWNGDVEVLAGAIFNIGKLLADRQVP